MRRTYYAILMPGETEPTVFFGHDLSLDIAIRDAREAARAAGLPDEVRVAEVDVDLLTMRIRGQ